MIKSSVVHPQIKLTHGESKVEWDKMTDEEFRNSKLDAFAQGLILTEMLKPSNTGLPEIAP